ncbi:type II secretion system major pseudopilin GspG [Desulfurobacterium atlanticum]|uniref:Type II secretion system core protein G n=1 Tax=Desulfurobacterium atlanticum TaxID=240169 RepID=A0A238ZA91_9BACT|nr:type II secretion system major pseudopilin GspG [Desulfurobacterium atlanticum]SNR80455.1 type II secretion system protein G (GspG) [Desulfurobacterium atlanticum]
MRKAFTLIELLVVVVILSLLAAIVVPKLTGRVDETKVKTTKVQLKEIKRALEMYKLDNGMYPTTSQGLKALVENPETPPVPSHWRQYLNAVPKDGWGNDFVYISPADKHPFELKSKGPDGELGTEDDISVWDR